MMNCSSNICNCAINSQVDLCKTERCFQSSERLIERCNLCSDCDFIFCEAVIHWAVAGETSWTQHETSLGTIRDDQMICWDSVHSKCVDSMLLIPIILWSIRNSSFVPKGYCEPFQTWSTTELTTLNSVSFGLAQPVNLSDIQWHHTSGVGLQWLGSGHQDWDAQGRWAGLAPKKVQEQDLPLQKLHANTCYIFAAGTSSTNRESSVQWWRSDHRTKALGRRKTLLTSSQHPAPPGIRTGIICRGSKTNA